MRRRPADPSTPGPPPSSSPPGPCWGDRRAAVAPESFELTTAISNLRDLRASMLGPYDAVYLGNLYCRRYEGNLLERPDELGEAVRTVRDLGRRAYVMTYAAPNERDVDRL